MWKELLIAVLFVAIKRKNCDKLNLDLPEYQFNYVLRTHRPEVIRHCSLDPDNAICQYINSSRHIKCWGYEEQNDCQRPQNAYYVRPECDSSSRSDAEKFYKEADFGYIEERRKELRIICRPSIVASLSPSNVNPAQSKLECSDFARFCRADNLWIDLRHVDQLPQPMRYRSDVIGNNQIGGFGCDLDQQALWRLDGHKSPLQSWYEELEHYRSLNSSDATQCDVTISAKTYIVKLDAAVNMYHHFCDFVNLYATLHLNDDLLGANQDHVQILLWDTQQYRSPFAPTWAAITGKPVWNLAKFAGQRVCFRRVVFPLLPRMIFGLYYNMPLQPGCHGSGLIHAFARHVTHRLGVHQLLELQQTENERPIRVTFISRSTDYRRVLNEGELIQRLNEKAPSPMNLRVRIVDYGNIPFEQQLQITLNTDILIGMHGAGLTHLLFLPDWAVVFELFHCDDPRCYSDLARLRGLHYLTWHNRSKIESQPASPHAHRPAHLKFTNFRFDPDEFVRLTLLAAFHVKQHRAAYIQRSLSNNDTMSTHSFVPNTTHHEL